MAKNKKLILVVLSVFILLGAALMFIFRTPDARNYIKSFPTAGSSDDEKYAYALQAEKIAQEAAYLDVTDCVGTPAIFKVKNGATFNIRNNGNTVRLLSFPGRDIAQVPGMTTIQYTAFFGANHTDALYGYGCDLVKGEPAGMIFTVK